MKADLEKMKRNLEKNGFQVTVFDSAKEAVVYLAEEIKGKTVGMGGSTTIDQMGLYESLYPQNQVYWHWRLKDSKLTEKEIYTASQTSQVYISSANGISETGEIVNIDGFGNRISACLYGHEKVYYVVGTNKVAATLEDAIWRARNIAAPKNAKRIKKEVPCALKEERCYDCDSPQRICKGLSILWKAMSCCETEVVVINEELGF